MRLRTCLAALAALCALVSPAASRTGRDLSGRIHIDGYASDYVAGDEDVFGLDSTRGVQQEARDDSRWQNNEIYQIRVTWDSQNLYLAGEGKIWGNNMILFIDSVPRRGFLDVTNLNSWRRNFTFHGSDTTGVSRCDDCFLPDVFGATWDGNTSPKLITKLTTELTSGSVDDHAVGAEFQAAASFDQGNDGRAMEFAIPWRNVFGGLGLGAGLVTDQTLTVGGITSAFHFLPPGVHSIRIAGVVTGGGDGTGGPESAPDNLRGHTDNGNDNVFIDNYAIIDLDRNDDTGLGAGGPDGIPDWDVSPKQRVSFRFPPPIKGVRFAIDDLWLDRPVIAPDRGDSITFHVRLAPRLNLADPIDAARVVEISSSIYDASGHFVRSLQARTVTAENFDGHAPLVGAAWNGRDNYGRPVRPGIYVLRTVIEPNLSRAVRALVVVR